MPPPRLRKSLSLNDLRRKPCGKVVVTRWHLGVLLKERHHSVLVDRVAEVISVIGTAILTARPPRAHLRRLVVVVTGAAGGNASSNSSMLRVPLYPWL